MKSARKVLVLLLAMLLVVAPVLGGGSEAKPQGGAIKVSILPTRSLQMTALSDKLFQTFPVILDPLTASLTVRLRRPTTLSPLAWDATGIVRVSIVVTLDGVEYRCTGQAQGGLRAPVNGTELPYYQLTYTPPWGFFGARGGATKRLGELQKTSFTAHVEIERIAGSVLTDIEVTSVTAAAPLVDFHSSVAFDAASSAEEISGGAGLSWSHTASGSDRAAFVGVTNYHEATNTNDTPTYAGTAMTEQWDFAGTAGSSNGKLRNSGNYRVAVETGVQTVVANTSPTNSATYKAAGVITMTGVHQTTPVGTHVEGSGLASPATVTSGDAATDDLVVDNLLVWDNGSGVLTIGADQTERNTQDWAPGNRITFKQSSQPGSAGGVMSWTITNIHATWGWVSGAVAFKPAGGAAPRNRVIIAKTLPFLQEARKGEQ